MIIFEVIVIVTENVTVNVIAGVEIIAIIIVINI